MVFENRQDAGRQLATQLGEFADRSNAIVLGIPRGGVVVAAEVARLLSLPLDIFLSHKLGVPGHEELAFGAIASGGGRYLDEQIIHSARVSSADIAHIATAVEHQLNQRAALYRGNLPPIKVGGKTVILVDDGIATGASAFVAVRALRAMQPAALILAVPVGPASTCTWLQRSVDRLVCDPQRDFFAVGQFYRSFAQVDDEVIVRLLQRAR
jgi:putative phosphoribosyl transferase